MRTAITGASGFVGRALIGRLATAGHETMPIVRTPAGLPGERAVGDLAIADWDAALAGTTAVVHLAARVHMMNDTATDPLAEFRRVNRDGALRVAEAAARQGAKRFLFVSTVKVNGEVTRAGQPFRADGPRAPEDAYAISKAEAEEALLKLGLETGMEITIIRPPLVYGPGVRGNFRAMIAAVRRRLPLPLGLVTTNRRSLVGLDNLTDLIAVALTHPAGVGETFLVSDGESVSTARLLRELGLALGKPAVLFPVPPKLLLLAAKAAGAGAAAGRLIGNLEVDISKTCDLLGWSPPVSLGEGLRRAIADDR